MTPTIPSKIGLIAGWGRYPVYLAEALKQQGIGVYCLGIIDHADPALQSICDAWLPIRLGRLQTAFRFFRQHGLTCGTLAGKINKKLLLNGAQRNDGKVHCSYQEKQVND